MLLRDLALAVAVVAFAAGGVQAQTAMPMDHAAHHATHHAGIPAPSSGTVPTMPGQDAFGAIQEIVRILEADPDTDWSKVDLEALRQHLIDMNEVTLNARAVATRVDGGARYDVSGEERTLEAIRRMVPPMPRDRRNQRVDRQSGTGGDRRRADRDGGRAGAGGQSMGSALSASWPRGDTTRCTTLPWPKAGSATEAPWLERDAFHWPKNIMALSEAESIVGGAAERPICHLAANWTRSFPCGRY